MKNNRWITGILMGFSVTALLCGCKVDDRFDLGKLNSEVTVKVPPVPVGNLERFSLKQIISLDEKSEYVTIDPNGDYLVSFAVDPFHFSVTVPDTGEDGPVSYNFDSISYQIDGLPDILTGEGQEIGAELSEIEVSVQLDSEIPADFTVGTAMETHLKGAVLHRYDFTQLAVPSGKSEYVLNEKGSGSRTGVTYKSVPELGKLLSPIPDELIIKDLTVSADADQRKKVVAGREYGITCAVSVTTPLAFSAESNVHLTIPVNAEVNLDQVGLKKAVLKMDVVNSIPLDFSISAYALDQQGNRLESVKATTDVPIKGGSVDSPAVTPATVTLTTDGDLRFSGIVLELSASSNASVAGIHFNEKQGIELRNVVVSFPEGIQVQIIDNK